jgi:hypothetical protein
MAISATHPTRYGARPLRGRSKVQLRTLGSGLNAGNIGAEIDAIKPALPAQTQAPIAIHFAFGISRTSSLYHLAHFATRHFLPL